MRHTSGHTGNRRSHHALKKINVITDKETGTQRLPHRLDETTGMYRGKQIAPARAARVSKKSLKGINTEPTGEHTHVHEHAHAEHANAELKSVEAEVAKVKREPRSEVKSVSSKKAK